MLSRLRHFSLAIICAVAPLHSQVRVPGPGGNSTSVTPWSAGFDFRLNNSGSGFTGDPTGYTFGDNITNKTWPATYTIGSNTVYGGYNQNIGSSCTSTPAWLNTVPSGSTDQRLYGYFYDSSVQCTEFILTLGGGAGTYHIYLASGQDANTQTIKLYDGSGSQAGQATSDNASSSITWVSGGVKWSPDMTGNTITYNSLTYTVVSQNTCTGAQCSVMVVTPSPGTNSATTWSYGAQSILTTSAPNNCTSSGTVANATVTSSGQYIDASGTTQANATAWVGASSGGGLVLTCTFVTNVLSIQIGGAGGYSTLANLFVTQ